jgi:hypothetical protein
MLQELCLYLDEERGGSGGGGGVLPGATVCTDCGGPLPGGGMSPPSLPPLPSRDEGDGSSSSTNNDESELSASNLVEELKAVQAREELYYRDTQLAAAKSGLNGKTSTQKDTCLGRY